MSAYFLNRAHIDALVTYASQRSILGFDKDALGRILWNENRESVRARYADADAIWPDVADVEDYTHRDAYVTTVAIVKACHCYAYQSCEHEGWAKSPGKRIVDVLEKSALHALGTTYEALSRTPAYAAAPWEISDDDVYREERNAA